MSEENVVAVDSKYKYIHEEEEPSSQMVDVHHVSIVTKRGLLPNRLARFFFALLFLSTSLLFLFPLGTGLSICYVVLYVGIMAALFLKLLRGRTVDRESVVIIPAFGVQLETHYKSGRATRRFVPVDKILKPVLSECVTPVTCYWTLALILRDEPQLMLVFKKLRPPLKMLAPIWKALCSATDSVESLEVSSDAMLAE